MAITGLHGRNRLDFGTVRPADLTFAADAGDWVKVRTGELDGMAAYTQGKLTLKGDMQLAMKFQSLFKRRTRTQAGRSSVF